MKELLKELGFGRHSWELGVHFMHVLRSIVKYRPKVFKAILFSNQSVHFFETEAGPCRSFCVMFSESQYETAGRRS